MMKAKPMNRVLIIDDEVDICFLLGALFRQMNYEVFFALGMEEGLRKARSVMPEVVLLDVNLPDGNGIDALPLIRQALPKSQILLMSAHVMEREKQYLKSRGADEFLLKPITKEMIAQALNHPQSRV